MHDIDRTQMEYEYEDEDSEFEMEMESDEFEFDEYEDSPQYGGDLSEADEYELASELLSVGSEEELDMFLGKLIKKVARKARRTIRSPIGRAVGGVLKGVAKKALPFAGRTLGRRLGGRLGARIGGGLASAAGRAIGLEAEALEAEQYEFEGAKQFVKIAADTVKKAATASPTASPSAVAQSAAISATRKVAPGLLKGGSGAVPAMGSGRSGRWIRRGNKIVLMGA